MNIVECLTNTRIFNTLLPEELAIVKKLFVTEYVKENRTIFTEGEPGNALYIIVSGGIAITKQLEGGKTKLLAQLGEGECFGELALIDGDTRSATVKTTRETALLVFRVEEFARLIESHPYTAFKIIMQLAKVLSNRLRETNNQVVGLVNFHLAMKEQP
ncbi:MAG TPA: cyclic nucleotide-binding domain-containing protein [bacterium]|nr:cyclic nucleotide-binding domain-containing protein [bacterium]